MVAPPARPRGSTHDSRPEAGATGFTSTLHFMLKITPKDYDALRRHGEETYPHECCGVLLGTVGDDGTRTVTSTALCGNTRTDSPQNRYSIDPRRTGPYPARGPRAR